MTRKHSHRSVRDGVVSVEFAFVAPVFVIMVVGLSQASYLFNVQNQFLIAAREGARIATHERSGFINENSSTNQKIETDIRNFLTANGLPGDDVDVFIADPDDKDIPFDLDAPENDLGYFQVRIEYAAGDLLSVPPPGTDSFLIAAKLVFRNGRSTTAN